MCLFRETLIIYILGVFIFRGRMCVLGYDLDRGFVLSIYILVSVVTRIRGVALLLSECLDAYLINVHSLVTDFNALLGLSSACLHLIFIRFRFDVASFML